MNLKQIRTDKKMSQTQVADFLGVSQCAYSYYEIGKRQPKPETLKKLSQFFGVTVDEILADPEEVTNDRS